MRDESLLIVLGKISVDIKFVLVSVVSEIFTVEDVCILDITEVKGISVLKSDDKSEDSCKYLFGLGV